MLALEIMAALAGVSGVGWLVWRAPRMPPAYLMALEAAMAAQDVVQKHLEKAPEPPPAVPWTRKDAARAAELYRQVPSAFWLAPEYTAYDGPEEPKPRSLPPRKSQSDFKEVARMTSGLLPNVYHGRDVITYSRDERRMGWRLRLERKPEDLKDPWVFLSDSFLQALNASPDISREAMLL